MIILTLAIGILLMFIGGCVSQCALFHGTKIVKPSPVDTSILKPLADYPNYDLDELKARIERLEGKENISDFSGNNNPDGSVQYHCNMGEWGGVSVSFWIENDSVEQAKGSFSTDIAGRTPSDVKYAEVGISEDIQIASTPVLQFRDSEIPWAYDSTKNLLTVVRIGTMIIDIHERSEDSKTIGTDTNKALAQIVEVLRPDAKTTPK